MLIRIIDIPISWRQSKMWPKVIILLPLLLASGVTGNGHLSRWLFRHEYQHQYLCHYYYSCRWHGHDNVYTPCKYRQARKNTKWASEIQTYLWILLMFIMCDLHVFLCERYERYKIIIFSLFCSTIHNIRKWVEISLLLCLFYCYISYAFNFLFLFLICNVLM